MKNELILTLINENKIEELKKLVIEEINKKAGGNTFKALLKLSKLAEKEQKLKKSEMHWNETGYMRPNIAGAYFNDNQTMICNGFWAIAIDEIITGLVEAPKCENIINLNTLFKAAYTGTPAEINMDELIEKARNKFKVEEHPELKRIRINGELFNAEYVYNMINCFDGDYKMYTFGNHVLQIESEGKKAIVMGIRE